MIIYRCRLRRLPWMNLIGIDWDRVEEVELIASIMTSTNLRQKTLHSLEINMAGVTTQK